MAGDTIITVVGNLVSDPELRFTPSGAAVANFRIASTPRTFDKQTNQWKDGEGLFLSCSVWRQAAENVAESLQKGMRVIVQGRLVQRSYDTKEGEKRTVVELQVDDGVDALGLLVDLEGEPATAPDVDLLHGPAAVADDVEERVEAGSDGPLLEVGVEDDHELVVTQEVPPPPVDSAATVSRWQEGVRVKQT